MNCRTLARHLCRALFVACVLTVLCSLAPALSSAAQVALAWDANTDPDLAGYKLYYSISSGSYQLSVDVGNQTSYTLSGLLEGQIYYFAATAYNLSGSERHYSSSNHVGVGVQHLSFCGHSHVGHQRGRGFAGGLWPDNRLRQLDAFERKPADRSCDDADRVAGHDHLPLPREVARCSREPRDFGRFHVDDAY